MGRSLLWIFSLLWGCTGAEDGSNNPSNQQEETLGDCDVLLTDWSTGADYTKLSIGGEVVYGKPLIAEVIRSAEELESFQTTYELTVEAVDFSSSAILVASVSVSSTCGLRDPEVEVYYQNVEGAVHGVHLEYSVTDPGGLCDEVCDMTAWSFMAIEVNLPVETDGEGLSVCTRRIDECN
jgi:hypothetical protein